MKKILIFSFVMLLLSASFVSASWFNDLFSEKTTGNVVISGDVQRNAAKIGSSDLAKSINKDGGTAGTFSRKSSTASAETSSAKRSSASPGPAWVPVEKAGGGTCYARKEGTTRGFGLFSRR